MGILLTILAIIGGLVFLFVQNIKKDIRRAELEAQKHPWHRPRKVEPKPNPYTFKQNMVDIAKVLGALFGGLFLFVLIWDLMQP